MFTDVEWQDVCVPLTQVCPDDSPSKMIRSDDLFIVDTDALFAWHLQNPLNDGTIKRTLAAATKRGGTTTRRPVASSDTMSL